MAVFFIWRINLDYKKIDMQIMHVTNNIIKNKYDRHNNVPNFEEIMTRRDYLIYRIAAIQYNHHLLNTNANHFSQLYEKIEPGDTKRFHLIYTSVNQTSFCFDDLIFNLASMLDYLGNYIGILIYGAKCQTIKWDGLVNKVNNDKNKNELHQAVIIENCDWFNKIIEYRGHVIHRKALKCEVEGFDLNERFAVREIPKLKLIVNPGLKKYFSIFRKEINRDIDYCSNKIVDRTLDGISKLLEVMQKYEFNQKYHWHNNEK